jgi:hypothetical protein
VSQERKDISQRKKEKEKQKNSTTVCGQAFLLLNH